MLLARKPPEAVIYRFVEAQARASLRYADVGATKTSQAPRNYRNVRHRVKLGEGEHAYGLAIKALYDYRMYRLKGVELYPPKLTVMKDETIAVLVRHFGVWSLNGCRIVYKLDAKEPVKRCGFGIGTLPEHLLEGEERFMVSWQEDDTVWYEFFSFIRAKQLLAQLGLPAARLKYRQFVRASASAMVEAVSEAKLETAT